MKLKALLAVLFSVVLVFGLATITNAQTNPDKNQKSTINLNVIQNFPTLTFRRKFITAPIFGH